MCYLGVLLETAFCVVAWLQVLGVVTTKLIYKQSLIEYARHLLVEACGKLQGLNKADAAAEHGDEQVLIWRRSFDVCPPALDPGDTRDPHTQEQYRDIAPDQLPYTECLKDTIARAWPYFEDEIRPQMLAGKRVLIAAHGNSLRSLVMKFEHLTPEEILKVNIPTGVPLVYTFDTDFNVLDKRYIGDPATIAAKIDAVANQGKAHK